jgi:hypothetical protein
MPKILKILESRFAGLIGWLTCGFGIWYNEKILSFLGLSIVGAYFFLKYLSSHKIKQKITNKEN